MPEVLLKPGHGEVVILQVVQMLKDGLPYIEGLGASGLANELLEPLLDLRGQAHGNHGSPPFDIQVYITPFQHDGEV